MSHSVLREATAAQLYRHESNLPSVASFRCRFSLSRGRPRTLSDFLQDAVDGLNMVLGRVLLSRPQAVDGGLPAILSARCPIHVLVSHLGPVGQVGDSAGDRSSSCRFHRLDLLRRAAVLLHGNHSRRSDFISGWPMFKSSLPGASCTRYRGLLRSAPGRGRWRRTELQPRRGVAVALRQALQAGHWNLKNGNR